MMQIVWRNPAPSRRWTHWARTKITVGPAPATSISLIASGPAPASREAAAPTTTWIQRLLRARKHHAAPLGLADRSQPRRPLALPATSCRSVTHMLARR